ncbi:MAG TPA: radical SAM protein [Candidatus Brocadiales bacterium]|nr:radical SAM protein [Candidatus Brocadiales bacterium]
MNILLLNMPDYLPFISPQSALKAPHLGLCSVAASLPPGHNVYVGDLVNRRSSVRESIIQAVNTYKPHLVGISSMTFQYRTARKIAQLIKNNVGAGSPRPYICLGGYHATLMGEELCAGEDSKLFDFLICGEGETTFRELVEALEGKGNLGSIAGLAYKEDGVWRHNPRRPLLDLKTLPLPERSKRIWTGYAYHGTPVDTLETSRGCTFTCNFCSMHHMYSTTFRTYEIPRVIADIENCKRAGAKMIMMIDDNITLNPKRLLELCETIVKEGHNDLWYWTQVSSRGIASIPELSRAMAQAGFKSVFLGIENVSKRNLEQLKKGDIVEYNKKAIRLLHDNKILIVGGMIVGNPDDTYEDTEENFKFFKEQGVDFYFDQILTPYPKTGIREELMRQGLVTNPDDFTRYNGFWANVRTKHLSDKELEFVRWKLHREYYTLSEPTPLYREVMGTLGSTYRSLRNLWKKGQLFLSSERAVFEKEMEGYRRVNEYL